MGVRLPSAMGGKQFWLKSTDTSISSSWVFAVKVSLLERNNLLTITVESSKHNVPTTTSEVTVRHDICVA